MQISLRFRQRHREGKKRRKKKQEKKGKGNQKDKSEGLAMRTSSHSLCALKIQVLEKWKKLEKKKNHPDLLGKAAAPHQLGKQ